MYAYPRGLHYNHSKAALRHLPLLQPKLLLTLLFTIILNWPHKCQVEISLCLLMGASGRLLCEVSMVLGEVWEIRVGVSFPHWSETLDRLPSSCPTLSINHQVCPQPGAWGCSQKPGSLTWSQRLCGRPQRTRCSSCGPVAVDVV